MNDNPTKNIYDFYQVITAKGDVRKIDCWDVTVSTVNPFQKLGAAAPFLNETANALVDFKDGEFKIAFKNKSDADVMMDFAFGQIKAVGKSTYTILKPEGGSAAKVLVWELGMGLLKSEAKQFVRDMAPSSAH